jgi:hypothetical protein
MGGVGVGCRFGSIKLGLHDASSGSAILRNTTPADMMPYLRAMGLRRPTIATSDYSYAF